MTAATLGGRALGRPAWIATVYAVGLANALTGPAIAAHGTGGLTGLLAAEFGMPAAGWLVALIGLVQVLSGLDRGDHPWSPIPGAVCLVLLVVPSAQVNWLTLVAFCVIEARATDPGDRRLRAGLAILAALAAREPVTATLLQLFADPLLRTDAVLIASALGWVVPGVANHGNVISGPDGHQLLILTGCMSLMNMSHALLVWFALTAAASDGPVPRRAWTAGLAIAAGIHVLNLVRLLLMSLGPDIYAVLHDGAGRWVVDGLQVLLVFHLTLWGVKRDVPSLAGRCLVVRRPSRAGG